MGSRTVGPDHGVGSATRSREAKQVRQATATALSLSLRPETKLLHRTKARFMELLRVRSRWGRNRALDAIEACGVRSSRSRDRTVSGSDLASELASFGMHSSSTATSYSRFCERTPGRSVATTVTGSRFLRRPPASGVGGRAGSVHRRLQQRTNPERLSNQRALNAITTSREGIDPAWPSYVRQVAPEYK